MASARLANLLVLVVTRNFCPEPDKAVLEIFVDPKVGDVGASIRMPAAVLTAGSGVHVENGIYPMLCACRDDAVEVAEPLGLQHARVKIVLEMAVADRDADTVQAERLEERGIWLGKEVFEELWERENMGESPKILGCWLSSGYSQRGHIIEAEGAVDQY